MILRPFFSPPKDQKAGDGLMCQEAYTTDILGMVKKAIQQVYTDVAGLATAGIVSENLYHKKGYIK